MSIPLYEETSRNGHSEWYSRIYKSMARSFSEELQSRLREKGMRQSELARLAKTTRQNINRLVNSTPHGITGAPPTAEVETVERIAHALDWDIDDARLAAGYAPAKIEKPETLQQLMEALTKLGIPIPEPYGGFPPDEDGEGFAEILERLYLDFQLVLSRQGRKRPEYTYTELKIVDNTAGEDENKKRKGM